MNNNTHTHRYFAPCFSKNPAHFEAAREPAADPENSEKCTKMKTNRGGANIISRGVALR